MKLLNWVEVNCAKTGIVLPPANQTQLIWVRSDGDGCGADGGANGKNAQNTFVFQAEEKKWNKKGNQTKSNGN